jgi:hypothetical protein
MAGFGKGAMGYKPPKLGVVHGLGMGKQARADIPRSAGSKDTRYVAGFNPRKARYTASTGTNPTVKQPPLPSLTSGSAPYKHEAPTGGKFQIEGWPK